MLPEGTSTAIVSLLTLIIVHGLIMMAQTALRHDDVLDEPRLYFAAAVWLWVVRAGLFGVAALWVGLGFETRSTTSTIVALGVCALLVFLLGELVPVAVGRVYARSLGRVVRPAVRLLALLATPLVAPALAMDVALRRALSNEEDVPRTAADEEIMSIMDEKVGTIENDEREMILSVLEFGETLVREVMIPRIDISAVEIGASIEDALRVFIETGHSRVPVFEESIDNIKGLLYAKDLLHLWVTHSPAPRKTIRELMRPAYFVPETKRADTLFREMQTRKTHLAMVVDEYGGTAGLVTIEDLVEEIVGDIQDEYDLNEEVDYVRVADDVYIIDAAMNVDDVNDLLDVTLPTEDHDTLGGLVFGEFGRVPEQGETLALPEHHLTIRVESVEGRRIRKLHVTRQRPAPPADEDADRDKDESGEHRRVGGTTARGTGSGGTAPLSTRAVSTSRD